MKHRGHSTLDGGAALMPRRAQPRDARYLF